MKGLGLWILIVVILGGGVWWYSASQTDTSADTNQEQETETDTEATNGRKITLAEIAEHDSAESCWMAIEGKVYDVTPAIGEHPGGEAILQGCGTDATALFNDRPEVGTPHPSNAREFLPNLEIGVLVS